MNANKKEDILTWIFRIILFIGVFLYLNENIEELSIIGLIVATMAIVISSMFLGFPVHVVMVVLTVGRFIKIVSFLSSYVAVSIIAGYLTMWVVTIV